MKQLNWPHLYHVPQITTGAPIWLHGMDRDSSIFTCITGIAVSIATCYGLDGLGIKFWCGRDIWYQSRLALRPTQPPIQWVPGPSWGLSGQGMALTPYPHLSGEVKERVELYFYFPFRPSWPVLGWNLPLPTYRHDDQKFLNCMCATAI